MTHSQPYDRSISPDTDAVESPREQLAPSVETEYRARSGTIETGVEGLGDDGRTESLLPLESESIEHVPEGGHDDSAMTD